MGRLNETTEIRSVAGILRARNNVTEYRTRDKVYLPAEKLEKQLVTFSIYQTYRRNANKIFLAENAADMIELIERKISIQFVR